MTDKEFDELTKNANKKTTNKNKKGNKSVSKDENNKDENNKDEDNKDENNEEKKDKKDKDEDFDLDKELEKELNKRDKRVTYVAYNIKTHDLLYDDDPQYLVYKINEEYDSFQVELHQIEEESVISVEDQLSDPHFLHFPEQQLLMNESQAEHSAVPLRNFVLFEPMSVLLRKKPRERLTLATHMR